MDVCTTDRPPPPPKWCIRTAVHRRRRRGVPPAAPPLPPPLPMFEADIQTFASAPSVPRGFTLQNFRPAFGGDHRGTLGGGGSQPNPPPPFRPPPSPPSNTFLPRPTLQGASALPARRSQGLPVLPGYSPGGTEPFRCMFAVFLYVNSSALTTIATGTVILRPDTGRQAECIVLCNEGVLHCRCTLQF